MEITILSKNILERIRHYNDLNGIAWTFIFNELSKEFGDKEAQICVMDLFDQEMIEINSSVHDPRNSYSYLREGTFRITNKGRMYLSPLQKLEILRRYKTLCEWYEKEELMKEKEIKLTRYHLARYLFDQGFLPITEHQVPSGRVDVSLVIENGEFIAIEAKIFKGTKKDIQDLKNQILKRLDDYGISIGYGIIYNRSCKHLVFEGLEKEGEFSVFHDGNKTVYFLNIRLNKELFESIKENEESKISLT